MLRILLPVFTFAAFVGLSLATLSAQNVQPRVQRDSGSTFVREQVVDCGTKNPKEVCVISYDSETPR